jgi:hypothetical protein
MMGDENAIVRAYENKAESIVLAAKSVHIVDESSRKIAAAFATEARSVRKEIEERRKEITGPLNQSLKKINAMFNSPDKRVAEVQDLADGELKRDWLEFESARLAAQAALNLQNSGGDSFVPNVVLPETEKTVKTEYGSITIRKDTSVSVGDKMTIIRAIAECKLPLILADIDLGAAKRYFKSAGMTSAPGFIITEDAIVSGRK